MPPRKTSELKVIMKAKDLCGYVMTATQKSPKHFRYTFVNRLQNLALNVIEYLYRANDVFVARGCKAAQGRRIEFQRMALTELRLLEYVSLLAMEQKCILAHQYEQISQMSFDCQNMLGAWMTSDRERFQS